MLAAMTIAAVFTQKYTERIKDEFDLRGHMVFALASAMGVLIAFGFGLAAMNDLLGGAGVQPVEWVDKVFTGLAIGAGAGFINEVSGR